jgi:amino acid transporter
MSTLPPKPSFNKNVPVVTSGGGTAAAYKDPNSPESILRATANLQAQAAVDSMYDNSISPYEGFSDYNTFKLRMLLLFLIILFSCLVIFKSLKVFAKLFLLIAAVFIIILVIITYSDVY